jgi:hypothetical protein
MFGISRNLNSKTRSSIRRACIEGLEARQMLSASPAVWADDEQGRLFTVNVGTGQTHVIGQMPADMYDIAFSPTGSLYGVDGSSNLWKINPNTASGTDIGALGTSVNSLVFSPSGKLYAAGSRLYSVNTSTGHASGIGNNLNGFSSAGDLAFDASGNLYLSTTSNDLVRVNTSTGAASKIGPIGFNEVFGMAYGPDHVMYGLSDATQQIFSINLATGHGTLRSSFANHGAEGVNGSTFISEAVAPKAIEVDGSGLKIADGDTTPSSSDGTDFGSAAVNTGSVVHTFVIKNKTSATLHLTGTPRVKISGLNAADFTVITAPPSTVAPGGSTSFQVKFTPHGAGAHTATVTIANSDPHDGAYHFSIRGNGTAPKPTGTVIYACDGEGNLFTVSSVTGATHVIGHMSTVMYDIAFNAGGALYGIDSSNDIYKINPTNAATTFFGSLSVSDNINSLTFASNGMLYAAGQDLYKIDLAASKYYDLGYLGGFTSAGDLAFDKSGRLVMSTTSNQLIAVNPNTAQTALIGSIGFTDVLGLAEDSDGNLYGMSNSTDQIFSINPITGHGTSAVHFTGVDGVYGAAVKPA